MTKINPLIKIVGREYIEDQEIIKLKINNIDKIMPISATELFNNKKLIGALKYQDALSLGYSISTGDQVVKIDSNDEIYSIKPCFKHGICLILLL